LGSQIVVFFFGFWVFLQVQGILENFQYPDAPLATLACRQVMKVGQLTILWLAQWENES